MAGTTPENGPETLYEDDGARISRHDVRGWLYFKVQGRVTTGLVRRLRRTLYKRPSGNLALDTGDLAGVNAAFVGQVRMIAREVAERGDAFFLVQPGERVRDLLVLGGAEDEVRILDSADALTGDLSEMEQRDRALREVVTELARETSTTGTWRMHDGNGEWLCPVCAQFCHDVRVPGMADWPRRTLEAAAAHLTERCKEWRRGNRFPKGAKVLQARIAQRNALNRRSSADRAQQLESQVSTLREEVARGAELERGLQKARDRQARLLPPEPPAVQGVNWGLLFRPSARVSGDFYDFVRVSDRAVGIVVGDVSGHGIEAAILMGMAKKVLALRLKELGDAREALTQTNEDLRLDLDGRTFVSALVAVLDLPTRRLAVARAGHNPPLLLNAEREPILREVEPPGMVLGMADTERFGALLRDEIVELRGGDTLLLYTDGLTETENPVGMEFGVERVGTFLRKNATLTMQEQLELIYLRLCDFQGGTDQCQDDLTIIGMQFE
jgi:serine phosphatase RsbU (regulator of sigma subunit)